MANYYESLEKMITNFKEMANYKVVFGDVIELDGYKIVPMIQITLGFGTGGGEGEVSDEKKKKKNIFGKGAGNFGGIGGGMRIIPVAVIVSGPDGVQILSVSNSGGTLDKMIDKAPEIIDKIKGQA